MQRLWFFRFVGLLIAFGGGYLGAECPKGIDLCFRIAGAAALAYIAALLPELSRENYPPGPNRDLEDMKTVTIVLIQVVLVVVWPRLEGEPCVSFAAVISFLFGQRLTDFLRFFGIIQVEERPSESL